MNVILLQDVNKLGKKGKYIETIRGVGYKFEVK